MPRDPPPGAPSLGRAKPTLQSVGPVIHIFCEGETESDILSALRAEWRIPQRRVEVTGSCGAPSSVVRRAKRRLSEVRAHGGDVWAVFDRDEHTCWLSVSIWPSKRGSSWL